jgi:hypothetical protein
MNRKEEEKKAISRRIMCVIEERIIPSAWTTVANNPSTSNSSCDKYGELPLLTNTCKNEKDQITAKAHTSFNTW